MFRRLKGILREWLRDEEESPRLDCVVLTPLGPSYRTYLITGSRGACLLGTAVDGRDNSTRAIRPEDAVSSKKFWNCWNRLNPGCRLTWEDGTPYEG